MHAAAQRLDGTLAGQRACLRHERRRRHCRAVNPALLPVTQSGLQGFRPDAPVAQRQFRTLFLPLRLQRLARRGSGLQLAVGAPMVELRVLHADDGTFSADENAHAGRRVVANE